MNPGNNSDLNEKNMIHLMKKLEKEKQALKKILNSVKNEKIADNSIKNKKNEER
jgi:hypothetical protein